MKKSLKVFWACFLGGGIGTLTALQINGYFWWIGLLVGSLVGYFSYDFKAVLKAVPKAWRAVIEWRPNKKWWHNFGKNVLGMGSVFSNLWFFVLPPLLLDNTTLLITEIIIVVVATLGTSVLATDGQEMSTKQKKQLKLWYKYNVGYIYLWLPLKYIVLCLIWLVKLIIFITLHTPGFISKSIVILAHFIKTFFILIHSEIRLLCGIDAAIGATIGYFAGNVIVGAIAGGAFGLLNYEIISVRVLHLNASRIKNT